MPPQVVFSSSDSDSMLVIHHKYRQMRLVPRLRWYNMSQQRGYIDACNLGSNLGFVCLCLRKGKFPALQWTAIVQAVATIPANGSSLGTQHWATGREDGIDMDQPEAPESADLQGGGCRPLLLRKRATSCIRTGKYIQLRHFLSTFFYSSMVNRICWGQINQQYVFVWHLYFKLSTSWLLKLLKHIGTFDGEDGKCWEGYLSDDAGALIHCEALVETLRLPALWVPFRR